MACYRPRPAWKAKQPNQNGKHELTFSHQGSQLDPDYMIPCGKCDGCAANKSLNWAIRIYHESKMHDKNCFVTLTYAKAPPQLEVEHLQSFIKRLRRRVPIRYFACGEYGEESRRPHYHAILFGADFLGGAYDINDQLYGNQRLDKIWGHGITSIAPVNMATSCYVAGYVNKKINDPDTFSVMSKSPPLGRTWLDKNIGEIAALQKTVIDGSEYPIPPQYLEWFPDELEHVKANRGAHCTNYSAEQLKNRELNYKSKHRLKDHKL